MHWQWVLNRTFCTTARVSAEDFVQGKTAGAAAYKGRQDDENTALSKKPRT